VRHCGTESSSADPATWENNLWENLIKIFSVRKSFKSNQIMLNGNTDTVIAYSDTIVNPVSFQFKKSGNLFQRKGLLNAQSRFPYFFFKSFVHNLFEVISKCFFKIGKNQKTGTFLANSCIRAFALSKSPLGDLGVSPSCLRPFAHSRFQSPL